MNGGGKGEGGVDYCLWGGAVSICLSDVWVFCFVLFRACGGVNCERRKGKDMKV